MAPKLSADGVIKLEAHRPCPRFKPEGIPESNAIFDYSGFPQETIRIAT